MAFVPRLHAVVDNPEDTVISIGVQTEFDHLYRRYARLLRETIPYGRPTPESIVSTSPLRDSLRTEFLLVTAEHFGQWDANQQIAYLINTRNLLLLSRIGLELTDSSEFVLASRTTTLDQLNQELRRYATHDPRFAICSFSTIPFSPNWSPQPVKAELLDSTLADIWREFLNRPEVITINVPQQRISVNRWMSEFSDNLSANWASSSRFVNADPEVAPLLAFLWSVADDGMRVRLESTDHWRLVRPAKMLSPLAPIHSNKNSGTN